MAEENLRMLLVPEDDYMHPVEAVANFNESMYFNVFDPNRQIGGWFRIGNRPNEGHAEMTVCVYLPDGRVGFMFRRAAIADNERLDAGGLAIAVIEPHRRLAVRYSGKLLLLGDPLEMADPGSAFKNNPTVPATVDMTFDWVSPMLGGEPVHADGSRIELDAERTFARGHTEQHTEGRGHLTLDGVRHDIQGFGLRDHSWGPRYWQAIHWYRWCPMNFGRDFAMMLSVTCAEGSEPRHGGVVLEDGRYRRVKTVDFDTEWDEHHYQKAFTAHVTMADDGEAFDVEGRVMSLIPLRNRRTSADGEVYLTRITEGMTEYRAKGRTGYGLSEFLDQINDHGLPVSVAEGRA